MVAKYGKNTGHIYNVTLRLSTNPKRLKTLLRRGSDVKKMPALSRQDESADGNSNMPTLTKISSPSSASAIPPPPPILSRMDAIVPKTLRQGSTRSARLINQLKLKMGKGISADAVDGQNVDPSPGKLRTAEGARSGVRRRGKLVNHAVAEIQRLNNDQVFQIVLYF